MVRLLKFGDDMLNSVHCMNFCMRKKPHQTYKKLFPSLAFHTMACVREREFLAFLLPNFNRFNYIRIIYIYVFNTHVYVLIDSFFFSLFLVIFNRQLRMFFVVVVS